MQDQSDLRCDLALARATLYRTASHAFRHPTPAWHARWRALAEGTREAALVCGQESDDPRALLSTVEGALECRLGPAQIAAEHARVIGHIPRAAATPYETEWTGAAGELLQFHQISDIAAFYRAFSLELAQDCDERPDHVSVELAFLHYLCVKEAWAEEQGLADLADICRATERQFLSEHLARWVLGLCARLEQASRAGFYGHIGAFLRAWIEAECRHVGAQPAAPLAELSTTSFHPEDACLGCGHAAACAGELSGAARDDDDHA